MKLHGYRRVAVLLAALISTAITAEASVVGDSVTKRAASIGRRPVVPSEGSIVKLAKRERLHRKTNSNEGEN